LMLPVLALAAASGTAHLLLFEVASIRIRSPSTRTAGGAAILTY
jgi:hypothetical protein